MMLEFEPKKPLISDEQHEYFDNLIKLIETTYISNGNKSIIMVTHSMGSIMTLFMLNHKSQEWKDKYIRAHISMAGVWGGSELITILYFNSSHH